MGCGMQLEEGTQGRGVQVVTFQEETQAGPRSTCDCGGWCTAGGAGVCSSAMQEGRGPQERGPVIKRAPFRGIDLSIRLVLSPPVDICPHWTPPPLKLSSFLSGYGYWYGMLCSVQCNAVQCSKHPIPCTLPCSSRFVSSSTTDAEQPKHTQH